MDFHRAVLEYYEVVFFRRRQYSDILEEMDFQKPRHRCPDSHVFPFLPSFARGCQSGAPDSMGLKWFKFRQP
jgi:hypothetical protein